MCSLPGCAHAIAPARPLLADAVAIIFQPMIRYSCGRPSTHRRSNCVLILKRGRRASGLGTMPAPLVTYFPALESGAESPSPILCPRMLHRKPQTLCATADGTTTYILACKYCLFKYITDRLLIVSPSCLYAHGQTDVWIVHARSPFFFYCSRFGC